ncbi:hypothetical protein RJT34_18729 [Clitoria ternatea]|uniref:Uncharacterized protein n=1 Tax=Clitoria ternatea TaxID=43366 RepID=A0AAN9PG61_CLITE
MPNTHSRTSISRTGEKPLFTFNSSSLSPHSKALTPPPPPYHLSRLSLLPRSHRLLLPRNQSLASSSASPPPFPLASSPASSLTASPNTSTPPLSTSPSLTSPSVSPPTSTTSSPRFSVTPPCFSTIPDAASSLSSSDWVTSLAATCFT